MSIIKKIIPIVYSPFLYFRYLYVYLMIISFCRKHRNDLKWKELNLRHDWIYRFYTVINFDAADEFQDDGLLLSSIINKLNPISEYLSRKGVSDYVNLSFSKIQGYNSYLIILKPFLEGYKHRNLILFISCSYLLYYIFNHFKGIIQ